MRFQQQEYDEQEIGSFAVVTARTIVLEVPVLVFFALQ